MQNILVIENAKNLQQKISQLLEINGYKTYCTDTGNSGLEIAKEIIPDLIISDVIMPGLDGISLLKEIRKNPITSAIPFIFLTVKADYKDIRLGMTEGADDYIVKPFKTNDLLKSIKTQLKKRDTLNSQLDYLRKSLLMNVPHEMRTPLMAILGYSKILKDEMNSYSKEEINEMVEAIYIGGIRLCKHLNKYLAFIDTEISKNNPKQFYHISRPVFRTAHELIKRKSLLVAQRYNRESDITFNLTEDNITISEHDLERIVEELTENACKFSPQNTKIIIRIYIQDSFFFIEVENSGNGLLKEQIARIGPFIQFDRYQYDKIGIGLGLSIVQNIASIYNGSLLIKSEPGKTTKITVKLSNKIIAQKENF